MLPVLDLVPMIAPADAVGALAVLGDQTLETHAAGGVEQVWSDLSLLEGSDEDVIRPAAQDLFEVGLAEMQRQAGEVVAAIRQAVESSSCWRECRASKSEIPSTPSTTGFAVQDEPRPADLPCRLDDPGVPLGPVPAALGT